MPLRKQTLCLAALLPLAAVTLTGCGGGSNSSPATTGVSGSTPAAVSGFLVSSGSAGAGGGSSPTLNTVSAVTGSAGATVLLVGTHLAGATGVDFGSTPGTAFGINNGGTQITVIAPSGTGTVPVTVLTPGGSLRAGTYTYIPPSTTTGYAEQSRFGNTGTHATGLLTNPGGTATDAAGDIFVVDAPDTAHPRIVKYSSAGTFETTFGDTGTTATGLLGGGNFQTPGQLLSVSGIATDPAGNVYVADGANNRIVKYTSTGTFLTAFGDTGTAATGLLSGNSALVTDPSGDVYASNSGHIVKYSSTGTYLATLDATGGGHLSSPGAAEGVDSSGNLYLTDGSRIVKTSSTGAYLATVAPNYDAQYMGRIGSLTADGTGDVFFTSGTEIWEFPASGRAVSIFGPTPPSNGLVGLGGISVDSAGNIYASDIYSASVFKFTIQTIVSPISPSSGQGASPA